MITDKKITVHLPFSETNNIFDGLLIILKGEEYNFLKIKPYGNINS